MERKWNEVHMLMNNICNKQVGETSVGVWGERKMWGIVLEHMAQMVVWIRIRIMKTLWGDCKSLKGMSWKNKE